jgi:SAM-dependent methyltransferase
MYNISVNSTNKTLQINVSEVKWFKHFQKLQSTPQLMPSNIRRLGFVPTDDLDRNISLLYNNYWQIALERRWYDDLPTDPNILDIGSGIGFIDFLAYQYLDNTGKFYLLDANKRTRYSDDNIYSTEPTEHGFYNRRAISEDIIKSTNLNAENFIFLDVSDIWPDVQFDLITSFSSWCWHYPLKTYWSQVKTHLKIGGKLILTISHYDETESNVIDTISKEFNSDPILKEPFDSAATTETTINQGFRCCWIKK